MINKNIKKDNKCKYLNCKKFTEKDFCNMHRYKCLLCDTRLNKIIYAKTILIQNVNMEIANEMRLIVI